MRSSQPAANQGEMDTATGTSLSGTAVLQSGLGVVQPEQSSLGVVQPEQSGQSDHCCVGGHGLPTAEPAPSAAATQAPMQYINSFRLEGQPPRFLVDRVRQAMNLGPLGSSSPDDMESDSENTRLRMENIRLQARVDQLVQSNQLANERIHSLSEQIRTLQQALLNHLTYACPDVGLRYVPDSNSSDEQRATRAFSSTWRQGVDASVDAAALSTSEERGHEDSVLAKSIASPSCSSSLPPSPPQTPVPRKQALEVAGVVSTGKPASRLDRPDLHGFTIPIWAFLAGILTTYVDSPMDAPEDMAPCTVFLALFVVIMSQNFWLPPSSHITPSLIILGRLAVFAMLLSAVATCTIPPEMLFTNVKARAEVGILPFFLQGFSIGVVGHLLGGARYIFASATILTAAMVAAFVRLDDYLHSNETYGDPRVLIAPYVARPLGMLMGLSGSYFCLGVLCGRGRFPASLAEALHPGCPLAHV